MACEAEAQRVADAIQALRNAEAGAREPGSQRDENDPELKAAQAELLGAQKALAECQANAPPPPPPVVAPREILDIVGWTNPTPPDQSQPDWPNQIVGGKGTFPANAPFEWLQVLDPGQEYDDNPVGAAGWVLQPDVATNDFYFSHPWGNDFEFFLALDVPRAGHPEDVNYQTLLAPGNSVDVTSAGKLGLPTNVLGVEMESPLVPGDVIRGIREGDRAAVFGRWIIDTGHYFVAPPHQLEQPQDPGFRAEIHPPMLMATANVDPSTGVTRAIFASRPYLTGQTFGSLDTIYQDGVDDDGPFYSHMHNEIEKVLGDVSLSVEAHPKIKSKPFRGNFQFRIIVRPPAPPQRSPGLPPLHLTMSFKFTVRTGCAVQVTSDGDAVNVWIVMDSAGYAPPQLPTRNEVVLTRDELTAANAPGAEDAESAFDEAHEAEDLKLLFGVSGITLGSLDGVQTDSYDSVSYNMLGRDGAVINATPANLVPGRGIVTDDNQVYPVTGWLEVVWQAPEEVIVSSPAPTAVLRQRS
jgi:hypothetical protein